MHLAYSALNTTSQASTNKALNNTLTERYHAYQAVCEKYKHEIASIQKYLPGWVPAFNY